MENQTALEVLKETLETHPNIEEVNFLKDGSYSFNSYTDSKGKRYSRNGVEFINTETKKKILEFNDDFLITKTLSREEVLDNKIEVPKIKEPKEGKKK